MSVSETRNCQSCKNPFTIEPDDFVFYEKIKVPPPTWCPECRLVRRLMFRNERSLYKRPCDLCKKEKILMYPPQSPFTVYCGPCWWGDGWDRAQYAKDYDFSRPFFEQFRELLRAVPRLGLIQEGENVESEYANRVSYQRGAYLVFSSNDDEHCRYGSWMNSSKECMDSYNIHKCERCYECIDCSQCNTLSFSRECTACSNSSFLLNCRNCESCFGCVNLRNKSYCIFNKQYTKEEYTRAIAKFNLGSSLFIEGMRSRFNEFKKSFAVPAMVTYQSQGVSGNWIVNSKNVVQSFSCRNVEEGKHCFAVFDESQAMDHCFWGASGERIYESVNIGIQHSNVRFSSECWVQVLDLQYCMNCQQSSRNLFGCIGLKGAQYCILNKQYVKEEYEQLVPKIVQHMGAMPYTDAKGRVYKYGEFIPTELCPFAYNETLAQEFFPLTKEKAVEKGFAWREPEKKGYSITVLADALPDDIADISDAMLKEVIGCAHGGPPSGGCNHQCATAFRIIPDELAFYRSRGLPFPRLCPNCRHYERLAQRNPLKLWHRTCVCKSASHAHGVSPCPNEFETSYAPERPEIVYCEGCYQQEVA